MNSEIKNKWQIRMATLSIFLLGFLAGGFALNAYHLWFAAAKQPTKQERYDEAFSRLGLSETQKVEVQKIVGEIRGRIQQLRLESEPRMQEIRIQNDEKLQRVLTPEQWRKFQEERDIIRRSEKQGSTKKQLKLP
jgi:hypothetical protein